MFALPRPRLLLNAALLCLIPTANLAHVSAAAEIRDRAVVRLRLDEPSGNPADSATAGKAADVVTLPAAATSSTSVFVPGSEGRSLLLEPASRQYISIDGKGDTSRPEAVTVSGFFASLHPLSDNEFHGLFAKRNGNNGSPTNYGINFHPASDNFQLYVHDGAGYKVANYSVKAAIGYRRRVHLSAAFDQADAPGADADTDADDIRIRLFVNGAPLAPVKASGGFIEGAACWLTDTALARCVSETPLTIGSSFTDGEFTRMFCDDICVFAEALSDADAAALFAEAAGPAAAEIKAEQGLPEAPAAIPRIAQTSPHSAEIGRTTQITISGSQLAGAQLLADIPGITATPAEGSNNDRAVFNVAVDPALTPGRHLVRCVTAGGVSNPAIVSFDRVPTMGDGTFTEAAPAATFPIAVAGQISGTEQKRLWFRAAAGQKIVAEVEARRIGSRVDPVLEIRTQSGGPLAIQWQQFELQGDARTAVVIPADGLYYVELHDLQFQAPGGSSFRVIVGDLPPSAVAFPPVLAAAETQVRAADPGSLSAQPAAIRKTGSGLAGNAAPAVLPLPPLKVEPGVHVVEPAEGTFPADALDATFATAPFPALHVSGRITAEKETDAINIKVTAKQTLHFSLSARQFGSPLRSRLLLYNGDSLVAQNDGEAGLNDPSFAFAVPDGVAQLQVRIQDVNQRGSPAHIYRLQIARTDRQAFVLSTPDAGVQLPANGSAPLRLNVVRQSPSFRYTGPIRLSTPGSAGVVLVPDVIAPSEQDQQVLLMLTRSASRAADAAPGESLRIEARAEGSDTPYTTSVLVGSEGVPANALTLPGETLVAGPAAPVDAVIVPDGVPPILFRGTTASLPVRVLPLRDSIPAVARFEMLTTEPPRREDPNKPDSPLKPAVALADFQFAPSSQTVVSLAIRVPSDVQVPAIDAIIGADLVPQPLAPASGTRTWTAPLRFTIASAVTLAPPTEPTKAARKASAMVSITVQRHPLFTGPVTVRLDGLPQGTTAAPVVVPADQSTAVLTVAIPENAAVGDVPNVTATATLENGSVLAAGAPVKLTVE
ncbi:MAG: hypothetical protein RLZZ436_3562 [Planctomycetota bacterium]